MPFHALLSAMTQNRETASLMDDADIEAWWAEDADITGRLLVAIAAACIAVPAFNVRYDEGRQRFEPLSTIDIGIAIETETGVAMPVLADVGHKPITEIRRGLNALRTMIEDRSSRPSVTLVNFGRGPCRYASLPLVSPQVAIVAAGRVVLQPARQGGRIVHHHQIPLTLTYDTHASNLLGATRFLDAMKADLAMRDLPFARGWHD